ncbi:hypothetical protein [Atlantibacter sp.]|uniref:hypothetical protein n=1 Tax=Atlantibacter sp. TaxID=1903473 RepID=UPI0028B094E0|nr:hypothetical protein [Atlantibacter sp.]
MRTGQKGLLVDFDGRAVTFSQARAANSGGCKNACAATSDNKGLFIPIRQTDIAGELMRGSALTNGLFGLKRTQSALLMRVQGHRNKFICEVLGQTKVEVIPYRFPLPLT